MNGSSKGRHTWIGHIAHGSLRRLPVGRPLPILAIGMSLLLITATASSQTIVTLYGIADGGLRFDRTSIGTLRSVASGGESATRWGLRGTEDLGNGMAAVFTLEEGFDLSDNSANQGNVTPVTPSSPVSSTGSRVFGRVASVGLTGPWGKLRIGRDYSPYYQAWQTIDPFSDGFLGKGANIAPVTATRFDHGLYVDSPIHWGLQLRGAVQRGESTTDTASIARRHGGDQYAAALLFAGGPVLANYGFVRTRDAIDANATRAHVLATTWDLDRVKLHALAFFARDASRTLDARTWYGGLTVPLAPWTFFAGAAHVEDRTTAGRVANFAALATTYALSKQTNLYASTAHFANHPNASFAIADSSTRGLYTASNLPIGFNPTSFEFGLRYRF